MKNNLLDDAASTIPDILHHKLEIFDVILNRWKSYYAELGRH